LADFTSLLYRFLKYISVDNARALAHTLLMNKLTMAKRVAVVAALVEGNSIRSTARMTDVSKPTILKLLADLGEACATYHHEHVRNIRARRVQADEIWSFVGAKAKNATDEQKVAGWGDCWTWTAIDADTKLLITYLVGERRPYYAYEFMKDLRSRVTGRIQLTTDGLQWYEHAVEHAFGIDIDFARLQKHYAGGVAGERIAAVRYSPSKFTSQTLEVITGNPDKRHISTSYVERQNLSMRMGMRRFTRLTNGFSKKLENHVAANALYFLHYNFARIHRTMRVTPAMQAGIANHVWSIEEIVGLLDTSSAKAA
jgi:IS1 family transposase